GSSTPGWNAASRPNVGTSVASTVPSATVLAVRTSIRGERNRTRLPASGRKAVNTSRGAIRSVLVARRRRRSRSGPGVTGSLQEQEDPEQPGDPQRGRRGVELDQAVLQGREQLAAEEARQPRGPPHEHAVEQPLVELRGEPGDPLERPDDERLVDLVD